MEVLFAEEGLADRDMRLKDLLMLGRWIVGSYEGKEREERRGGRYI